MKLTKKLTLVTIVAGSLWAGSNALQAQDNTNTPPASSQTPGAPGMRGRPNAEQIAKELGLNDDQKSKLKTVLTDQQTKIRALREDTSLSQEDKRAKMKEIRADTQSKLKEILTADQFAKWQEHMKRNRPPGALGNPAQPSTTPPQ